MPTPFDYARLDEIDRQIADARALLVKLRQNANSSQAAQIDSTDKLLTGASSAGKTLRTQIDETDKSRQTALESADRLDRDLKTATSARAAAESQAKAAKAEAAQRELELADANLQLQSISEKFKASQQKADDDRKASEGRVRLLNDQLNLAADRLVNLQAELEQAKAKLAAGGRPKIAVGDMLAELGKQLMDVNAAKPTSDQPFAGAFVVERLDVELKGGIDLDSGIGLVPPRGDDLKPENSSTIRFSIRPAVQIREADPEKNESP